MPAIYSSLTAIAVGGVSWGYYALQVRRMSIDKKFYFILCEKIKIFGGRNPKKEESLTTMFKERDNGIKILLGITK